MNAEDTITSDGDRNDVMISESPPTKGQKKISSNANIPSNQKALGSVFVLDNVLLPLMRHNVSTKKNRESNLRSSLHLAFAKKFASRVCTFIDQQEKGIKFTVPKFKDTGTDDKVKRAEKLVSEWNITLTRIIEDELKEKPKNQYPIAEVNFWRRRHVVLSAIMEQIKSSDVQMVLNTIKSSGSIQSRRFHDNINLAKKLAVEAADNAKFLSTLERHLRTLSDGTQSSMVSAIPSLIDGMRMVWTISRYYNRDERMAPLFQSIGNQISSRVTSFLKPQDLRTDDLNTLKEVVQSSKEILETWRSSYMATREKIEEMGTGQRRWEFDRVLLFEKTDCMAQICDDFVDIIKTVEDLKKCCSPELLEITGDNDEVNNIVAHVDSLVDIIAKSQIDMFDIGNRLKWQSICKEFHNTAAMTEKSAEASIENAFKQLNSSETAYAFLLKLKGLGTRAVILEARYRDILEHYEVELDAAIKYFNDRKEIPPLCRRNHKTPGVVAWADDIYLRTKSVIVLFQKHGGILTTKRGEEVKRKYLTFAREIDHFKITTYEEWCDRINDICENGLKRPLLIGKDERCDDEDSSSEASPDKIRSCIKTNFSHELRTTIAEAKHFNLMGYLIPESLTYLTLQQDLYDRYLIDLEKIAKLYNSILISISPIESTILRDHITTMDEVLKPSFTYLNWSSQGVSAFITKANIAIDTFKAFLEESRKHSTAMDAIVNSIECESFVDTQKPLTSLGATIDAIEKTSEERGKRIEQSLKSMSPLILKIIMAISETNTMSPELIESFQSYFSYWEKRLYNAFVKLLLRSLVSAFFLLTHHVKMVDFSDVSIDSSSSPSPALVHTKQSKTFDANFFLRRVCHAFFTSINQYVRWKHKSCAEAMSANDDSSRKGRAFSYLNDISHDPSVYSLMAAMTNQCQRIQEKLK